MTSLVARGAWTTPQELGSGQQLLSKHPAREGVSGTGVGPCLYQSRGPGHGGINFHGCRDGRGVRSHSRLMGARAKLAVPQTSVPAFCSWIPTWGWRWRPGYRCLFQSVSNTAVSPPGRLGAPVASWTCWGFSGRRVLPAVPWAS